MTSKESSAAPDQDGNCTICGILWTDEELIGQDRHECPPGFTSHRAAIPAAPPHDKPDAQPTPRTQEIWNTLGDGCPCGHTSCYDEVKMAMALAEQLERELSAKDAELRAANERVIKAERAELYWRKSLVDENGRLAAERTLRERAERRLAVVEAKLDTVMMEHCPEEMTPEQINNWAAHQRVATAEETRMIDQAASTGIVSLDRHPILQQAIEVCWAIEECGASEKLTAAVTKASALLEALKPVVVQLESERQAREAAQRRLAAVESLLREWLSTELDSMDEEYQPWIDSFTTRVNDALATTQEGKS